MKCLLCLFVCLFGGVTAAEVRVFSVQDGLISEVGGGAVSSLKRTLRQSHSIMPFASSLTAGEVKGDFSLGDGQEETAIKPKTVFRELPDRFRLSIEPRFGRYASTKDFSVTVIGNTLQVLEARYMGYGLKLDLHIPIAPEKLSLPPHVALAPDGSIQISVMKVPSAQDSSTVTLSSLFGAEAGSGVQAVLPADLLALINAATESGNAEIVTARVVGDGGTISGSVPSTFHTRSTGSGSNSESATSSNQNRRSVNSDSSQNSKEKTSSDSSKQKKKLDAYERIRKAMSEKKSDKAASEQAPHQTRSSSNFAAPAQ